MLSLLRVLILWRLFLGPSIVVGRVRTLSGGIRGVIMALVVTSLCTLPVILATRVWSTLGLTVVGRLIALLVVGRGIAVRLVLLLEMQQQTIS